MAASSLQRTVHLVQKVRPDIERSRLVIISDCICRKRDIERSANARSAIQMPSLLIGFGSDPTQFATCNEMLAQAARRTGQKHGGILFDYSRNPDVSFARMFREFCRWAQNPELFPIKPQTVNRLGIQLSDRLPDLSSLPETVDTSRLTREI
jgi:hypothetical protein